MQDVVECISEYARELARNEHFQSLAHLAAGLADLEYPLYCRECRLYAERVVLSVIRAASLKPLVMVHEAGFTRFHVIAWVPGTPRVVLFTFGHGGEARAVRKLSLVDALHAVHRRGEISALRIHVFPELREYERMYRDELRRYEKLLGIELDELLGRRKRRR